MRPGRGTSSGKRKMQKKPSQSVSATLPRDVGGVSSGEGVGRGTGVIAQGCLLVPCLQSAMVRGGEEDGREEKPGRGGSGWWGQSPGLLRETRQTPFHFSPPLSALLRSLIAAAVIPDFYILNTVCRGVVGRAWPLSLAQSCDAKPGPGVMEHGLATTLATFLSFTHSLFSTWGCGENLHAHASFQDAIETRLTFGSGVLSALT
ncbi:hypothetical protein COCON_G00026750 [Conger conger]|uniref:Uncharacterized protein n=1 Tax=Conger conger TaxID=82655 RepID=A0A9Q1DXU9_CONCO|nr:hypothetical protein COCON_G00026750 [Conger conger]